MNWSPGVSRLLKQSAAALKSAVDEVPQKAELVQEELAAARKQVAALKTELALSTFTVQTFQRVNGWEY